MLNIEIDSNFLQNNKAEYLCRKKKNMFSYEGSFCMEIKSRKLYPAKHTFYAHLKWYSCFEKI